MLERLKIWKNNFLIWKREKTRKKKCVFYNRNLIRKDLGKPPLNGCMGRRLKNPFTVSKIEDQHLCSYCIDCPYRVGETLEDCDVDIY